MKYLILILGIFLYQNQVAGQCNCEKIHRDDGTTVTQCLPSPVSSDNSTQIGLAVASNGGNKFITMTVRFRETAMNVTGKITFRLTDNSMFSLELVNSALSYIGNSQVANAVFLLNDSNESHLKQSFIKTISFSLTDDLLHTYSVSMNSDVLKIQLGCL